MMSDENMGAPAPDLSVNAAPEAPEGDVSDESAPVATPEVVKEIKRLNKLQLKVHGQEFEEALPFSFEESPEAVEYLTKQLQLSKAAQRAMQENSSFQKQVGQFFQDLKSNTKAKLQELGIDPREFAASVIEEEIKKSQMSPEQIKQQELENELKELKEATKKKDEEFNTRELERLREIEFDKIETQMGAALDKTDLPKKPYVVRKIAEYMLIGANNGINLSPDDVLPLVRQEILSDLQELLNALPDDKKEEFIGKELMNGMRKRNIAKAKVTPASVKAGIKDVGSKAPTAKAVDPVNYKNFFGF